MSWFRDSERHALARLGISTGQFNIPPKKPKDEEIPNPKVTLTAEEINGAYDKAFDESLGQFDDDEESKPAKPPTKQKISAVDNQLQNHVHKFGHLVRRARNSGKVSSEELAEMQAQYEQAKVRANEYVGMQGSLPVWAGKDWVGKENWQTGGSVEKLLNKVKMSDGENQKYAIEELYSTINRFNR